MRAPCARAEADSLRELAALDNPALAQVRIQRRQFLPLLRASTLARLGEWPAPAADWTALPGRLAVAGRPTRWRWPCCATRWRWSAIAIAPPSCCPFSLPTRGATSASAFRPGLGRGRWRSWRVRCGSLLGAVGGSGLAPLEEALAVAAALGPGRSPRAGRTASSPPRCSARRRRRSRARAEALLERVARGGAHARHGPPAARASREVPIGRCPRLAPIPAARPAASEPELVTLVREGDVWTVVWGGAGDAAQAFARAGDPGPAGEQPGPIRSTS